MSDGLMLTGSENFPRPGVGSVEYSFDAEFMNDGELQIFHAKAFSLPPSPTSKIFNSRIFYSMSSK